MTETRPIGCETGLHSIPPSREPILHAVGHDGSHFLVTLDIAKIWGHRVLADGYGFDVFYAELYVGMPGEPKLMRCELSLAGTDKKPKLLISISEDTDGWLTGVLRTCDL